MEFYSYCRKPFEEIEIHFDGSVYCCCPKFTNFYSIGNIYQNSFDEIWNSDRAADLRTKILNNDYSVCRKDICKDAAYSQFFSKYNTECIPVMKTFPKVVRLCYDYECNIACRMCRNKIEKHSDEELAALNAKIEPLFLKLLQSAEEVSIGGGDPLASRHLRKLIKKVSETYPNIKFDFQTNGILCNEENFKELNIMPEQLASIRISIHAASADTYEKIVPGGKSIFPAVIKNLMYLKELRKTYNFSVMLHFVISSWNYYDIAAFIDLAERVNAAPYFWEVHKETFRYDLDEDIFIARNNHPMHSKLLETLKNPKIQAYKSNFSPVMQKLISEAAVK